MIICLFLWMFFLASDKQVDSANTSTRHIFGWNCMAREKAAMHFLNGLLHLLNGHRIFRPPRVRETKKEYEERKFVKKWLNDTVFL